ncbi:hypothetical protein LTR56_015717 [Elasticomyces elasticus]|nr:hypothetical protein LTR56_015717 [Elasticomyces elasticus]KAK3659252.1 hypothetical protein LTR22_008519 [Elasticomyces elasticus]KAK4914778.1 hypothetical protein LTR49_017013 [Elasticomyces elasticus]KAK5754248.1 hypothetical protein LTS12_015658 [Elasticomyces elasticus]
MSTPEPSTSPRLGVRERIDVATLSWSKTEEEPPFCATDLILMALLSRGCPLTRKEICKWMVDNFGYYRKLAAEALWGYNRAAGELPAVHEVHRKLDRAFKKYDLPVHVKDLEGEGVEVKYTAHAAAGSMLALPNDNLKKGAFPFFRLPAELRNTIYELVFQYPRSGLYFASSCTTQPRTLSRDLDDVGEFPPPASSRKPWEDLYLAKPVHVILEPLLTSRQFYNEAMPVFFQINTFYFPNYHTMSATLYGIPVAHKKHIRSVSFKLATYIWQAKVDENFVALLMLPDLRKMCIRFDEGNWLNGGLGVPAHQSIKEHPCANIRGQLYGLEEATFIGCPKLQALLKDGMLRPKNRVASHKPSARFGNATKTIEIPTLRRKWTYG